jgi:hypothetical protein
MVGQVILMLHAALAFKQSKVAFALKDNTNLLFLDSVYRSCRSMSRVSAMSRTTVRRHDVEQQRGTNLEARRTGQRDARRAVSRKLVKRAS